jgi:hypothetical protein
MGICAFLRPIYVLSDTFDRLLLYKDITTAKTPTQIAKATSTQNGVTTRAKKYATSNNIVTPKYNRIIIWGMSSLSASAFVEELWHRE